MRRGKPLARSRIKTCNKARREKRFAIAYGSPSRLAWYQGQPCATCSHPGPCEASHMVSRAAGGKADDAIPQCPSCHRTFHQMGRHSFAASIGTTFDALRDLAADFAARWMAESS